MKRVTTLLCLLLSAQAMADGLNYVPKWTMVDGKACYEFADAKVLVQLDLDLTALHKKDEGWTLLKAELEKVSTNLSGALEAEKAASVKRDANILDLNKQLTEQITRANKAEAQKMPSIGWLVAGATVLMALGAIAGVLVYGYVKK